MQGLLDAIDARGRAWCRGDPACADSFDRGW
jgi:hypothetical protein